MMGSHKKIAPHQGKIYRGRPLLPPARWMMQEAMVQQVSADLPAETCEPTVGGQARPEAHLGGWPSWVWRWQPDVQEDASTVWYRVLCQSDARFDRQFLGIRWALSYWRLLKNLGWKAAIVPCDADGNVETLNLRVYAASGCSREDE